ncbi:hypothetical protein PanWU01x14_334720, partial [Parasponia andersonii]
QARAQPRPTPPRAARLRRYPPPLLRRLRPELDITRRLRRPRRGRVDPRFPPPDAAAAVQELEFLEESGNVVAQNPDVLAVDVEDRVAGLVRRRRNVAVPVERDEDRRLAQALPGYLQGLISIVWKRPPVFEPEVAARDLLEEAEDGEVDENVKLLRRRRSPVGKTRGDRETFAEDGAEIWREGEGEDGLDGGEFDVGEAIGDGDVGVVELRD